MVPMSLKWQAHVAQVLHTKMKEWPPSMNIRRVAFLQDSNVAMRVAILDQLIDDCKNNLVEHTKTIIQPRPCITPVSTFAPPDWLERDADIFLPKATNQPAGEIVEYSISAKAFSSWLMAKDLKPSEVIKAWFDAYGVSQEAAPTVNAAPVLCIASTALTPVIAVAKDEEKSRRRRSRGSMLTPVLGHMKEIFKTDPRPTMREFERVLLERAKNGDPEFTSEGETLIVRKNGYRVKTRNLQDISGLITGNQ